MTPLSDLWLKRTTPLTSHTHDVMRVLTPFGVYSVESREQTDAERDESQSQRVRDTESETKEDGGETLQGGEHRECRNRAPVMLC